MSKPAFNGAPIAPQPAQGPNKSIFDSPTPDSQSQTAQDYSGWRGNSRSSAAESSSPTRKPTKTVFDFSNGPGPVETVYLQPDGTFSTKVPAGAQQPTEGNDGHSGIQGAVPNGTK